MVQVRWQNKKEKEKKKEFASTDRACSPLVLFFPSTLMLTIKLLYRITPFGEPPTPRAAHVATAVGTMVVIQVGILQAILLFL